MNLNSRSKSWLAVLLFLAGVFMGLAQSAGVAWGHIEAALYTSFNGDRRLGIECPLILAPYETGRISATIVNLTDKDIKPVVTAEISRIPVPRQLQHTVVLGPGASEPMEWVVDSSDVIFERLILVNIRQSPYRDNPSMLGSCGILLFSLFGLTGAVTLGLVVMASLAAMISGGYIWINEHRPLDQRSVSLVRVNAVLMATTILALLSTVMHLWGLAVFFDALILLIMGVILTDFVLFAQHST